MSAPDEPDDAVRRAFAALRERDAADLVPYTAVMARDSGQTRGTAVLWGRTVAAAALALALAAGLMARRPPVPPDPPSLASWTAPTDFLLKTPGGEILAAAPDIGSGRPLSALDGAGGGPDLKTRSASP